MNSFRSMSYLPHEQSTRSNITSRRTSKRNVLKQNQIQITNAFLNNQENYLPRELQQQIQLLPYISPNNIKNISFKTATSRRRSSAFQKHLEAMQNATRKQESMYRCFLGNRQEEEDSEQEVMEEEQPMTIEQNDQVSLSMHHCFFHIDNDCVDQEDFNLFSNESQMEDQIMYYSHNEIEEQMGMMDNYQSYLNV